MHLHIAKVRGQGKTYQYGQLLESYRRSDGVPAHRVVASLGPLEPHQIEQWRTALVAMRQGKPLAIVESGAASPTEHRRADANLRYLDLAVLLEFWQRWGLSGLLEELMPCGDALVSPAAVVAALTVQRCVEPAPTVYAPEWFPNTALPELLGVPLAQFNNTRLHRVLEELDSVGPALMARLPRLYQGRSGSFAAMFVDVTDTWFVGDGPPLAEPAKTKEGRFERKINIVLLCNQAGYPLRWAVFPGRRHDSDAILSIYRDIQGLSWVGKTPVVCDRAVGKTAHLRTLLETGLVFLTALTRSEFASYTSAIPYQPLLDFTLEPGEEVRDEDVARAGAVAQQAGMTKVADNLFVLDLGLLRQAEPEAAPTEGTTEQGTRTDPPQVALDDKTIQAMDLGRKLQAALSAGSAGNYRSAGAPFGLTKRQVCKFLCLTTLTPDLQNEILNGEARGLSVNDLERIAKLAEPAAQRAAFTHLREQMRIKQDGRKTRTATPAHVAQGIQATTPAAAPTPVCLRGVLYFNPEQFITQRLGARKTAAELDAFVADLNRSLSTPQSTSDAVAIAGRVHSELRKRGLLSAYKLEIKEVPSKPKPRFQVGLTAIPEMQDRRRRYDGFCLLVGHPEIQGTPAEICQLYRAKETIEMDFRTIKGQVQLRPLHHRTDAKVRAHVTICMLALLLTRTMNDKLKAGRSRFSVGRALTVLEQMRLNLYRVGGKYPIYDTTRPTEDQHAVLGALRFKHLLDDAGLADKITPR